MNGKEWCLTFSVVVLEQYLNRCMVPFRSERQELKFMIKKTSILISFILLNMPLVIQAGVNLPFYMPSGVTVESTHVYLNLIKEFEHNNPNISIRFVPTNSYEKVLAEVIKNASQKQSSGIIIAEISELLTLKYASAVIPLDSFFNSKKYDKKQYLAQFVPEFLANSYDDHSRLYAIPMLRSTPLIFYNLDLLEEVGYSGKNLPTTWSELEIMLKKLRTLPIKAPLGLANGWYDWIFESFVRQNDGALTIKSRTQVTFDSQPVIESLSFWQKLYQTQLMERIQGSWKGALNSFLRGDYPVIYYSSSGIAPASTKANFEWTASVMPGNRQLSSAVGASNIFISTYLSDEQKQAAWKFLHFLTDPEVQAKIAFETGYFPVIKKAFETKALAQRYNFRPYKNALEQLRYANAKMMTKNYKEIRQILKDAIDESLDKSVSPKESLYHAQKRADAVLKGLDFE